MASLTPVVAGNKSSHNDLDQVIQLLSGATTNIPIVISNRIQASMAGATANAGMIGGVSTVGPSNPNSPPNQPNTPFMSAPPNTSAGTFQVGDVAIDRTGVLWVCTGNTGGSSTPWSAVGLGADVNRIRSSVPSSYIGAPVQTEAVDMGAVDYGQIQVGLLGSSPAGKQGYNIATSGYYRLSATMTIDNMSSTTNSLRLSWVKLVPPYGPAHISLAEGDLVRGGTELDANGSTVDDIQYLKAGDTVILYIERVGNDYTLFGDGTLARDSIIFCNLRLIQAATTA